MSWLCMWLVELRYQRHLVDGCLSFEYELRIPRHEISKILYIRYRMKSSKKVVFFKMESFVISFEEINSRNEMR